MNSRHYCFLGLVTTGWLSGQLLRASAGMEDNPYQPIVTRNVFALVPIPTNAPVDPSSLIPPPKITPNGIMTLFGNLQVLFKVAGVARPGFPPKDESYVMSVGDREDDIEVEKIDEKSATITFNNHGSIQELGLVPATDSGGVPGAPGYGQPGLPMPGMGRGPGGFGRFGHSQNNPSPISPPSSSNPSAAGILPTAPPPLTFGMHEQITPEAQIIQMEIYRQQHQNDPSYPPMPPTVLSQPDDENSDPAPVQQ
jgi:hypothetical protein